jgi:UDP-N-acetylglucosamine 2-epimerase (non-hydrolysing)
MSQKPHLCIILGIRPDVIRASIFLNLIREDSRVKVTFIWSGQHYSDNLKDIFFKELGVKDPEIELGASGTNDAEVSSSIISKLYPVLERLKPDAAMFLGDTNTVISCIAAAQLNIPIIHFEGLMRSYDWRMPEEKYRGIIDHLSDIIYSYYPEYEKQGIAEGINPKGIVIVTNPIVDILNKYFYDKKDFFEKLASEDFFIRRKLEKDNYYVATWHRRENVHIESSVKSILELLSQAPLTVYMPTSYRTQKVLKEMKLTIPDNVIIVDPVGYNEFLVLMTNSAGVITDSGTVVEETSVLGIPSLQMRKATERPQTYDSKSSVKFDPSRPEDYPAETIFKKLSFLSKTKWEHNLGDGKASERIYLDVVDRLINDRVSNHKREDYHLNTDRSYCEDGINIEE